jgi:hypothetical protein
MPTTTPRQKPPVGRSAKWGYEPWKGPGVKPTKDANGLWLVPEDMTIALAAQKIFTGADAIGEDLGLLPDGLNLYGSYVDGFGGYPQLEAERGEEAFILSYTVDGMPGLCFDCEPRAMLTSQLANWYDTIAWHDAEGNVWGYMSTSNTQACINALGARKWIRVSAHFGHGPHICGPTTCGFPQADWNTVGRSRRGGSEHRPAPRDVPPRQAEAAGEPALRLV